MKRQLLLVALIALVTLIGMVGFSRAQTLSAISNAVSGLQATHNPTTGTVTELPATINVGVQVEPQVYYLTKNSFDGGDAIKACDLGFHMASISEIQDFSNLQYVNRSKTAYESPADDRRMDPPLYRLGWVRSGVYPPSGFVYDCEDFRDKDATQMGITMLVLYDSPFNSDAAQPPSDPTKGWYTTRYSCSKPEPVWCVED